MKKLLILVIVLGIAAFAFSQMRAKGLDDREV